MDWTAGMGPERSKRAIFRVALPGHGGKLAGMNHKERPRIVAVVSSILLLLSFAADTLAATQRPNILLIYADDQSYKTVSCYPEALPGARTPNIDRLAASGVRFNGAFLGAWCMPSRASMLTGRWPHGVESMR